MTSPRRVLGLPAVLAAGWLACRVLAQPGGDSTILQLLDNPVGDVLATYEKLTGKQVILEKATGEEPRITITVAEPVTRQKAVELIETSLLLNGYVLVPGEGNTLKALYVNSGRNPRSQGIPVFKDPDNLPEGAQLVTYVMTLKYLTPEEASVIFNQQAAPTPPFGNITPVPSAQSLIITETATAVRRLIDLQKVIDVPPPSVAARFVPLKRADAERVVKTIRELMRRDSSSSLTSAPRRLFGAGTESVELVADPRTNRIVVICQEPYFPYYRALIESFDEAAEVTKPWEMRLKFVAVADILPAIAAALREGALPKGEGEAAAPGSPQLEATGIAGNASTTAPLPGSGADGGISSGTSDGKINVIGTVKQPVDNTVPITLTIGKTKLIADRRNNVLLVMGPPESIGRIEEIVTRLDKPARQIYLATIVAELDVTDTLEYGTDLVNLFNRIGEGGLASSDFTRRGIVQGAQVVDPTALTAVPLFPAAPGLTLYGNIGTALDILISALKQTNRLTVLSRPSVYTSNNKRAVISVGQQVPVPSSTISTVNVNTPDSTALTSNIEYKDVVLQLEVVPLINNDDEVTLNIAQSKNELGAPVTIAGSTVNQINTQQLSTSVTVPNNHTLVIGGLIQERPERAQQGIPFLGDIPVLGLLFSSVHKRMRRFEIIIMIQPQIVTNRREAFHADGGEKARANVTPDAMKFAAPPVVGPGYAGDPPPSLPLAEEVRIRREAPAAPSPASKPLPAAARTKAPAGSRTLPPGATNRAEPPPPPKPAPEVLDLDAPDSANVQPRSPSAGIRTVP